MDAGTHLPALSAEISEHVQLIHNYALRNPATRLVIVPPLPRSVPSWFGPYLQGLSAQLCSEVAKLGTSQICCLAPFIAPPSFFESDGIHLHQAAGIDFIKYIIASVDQVYPVIQCQSLPSPSSRSPDEVAQVIAGCSKASPEVPSDLQHLSSAVSDLTALTQNFRDDVLVRRSQDNLVFARLKEDRDFELNKARENRFTLSGLKLRGDQVPPPDAVQRKEFFKGIIQALVDEACPDIEPKPLVQDVYVNMRRGIGTPFFEVRMDSVASSTSFRVAGSKLAKSETPPPNFAGLFIANAVTLTTRVRIEILRALSKILTSGTQDAFVKGFTSRPVLLVKAKGPATDPADIPTSQPAATQTGRSFTFCEAIEKWGYLLVPANLVMAYRKARPAFIGCLEQYFVVLKEHQDEEAADIFDHLTGASSSNSAPLGFRGSHRGGGTRRPPFHGQRGFYGSSGRRTGFASAKRPPPDSAGTPSKHRK